ncbi:MAG: cytochrome c1 [Pelagibacteraceae bacterium]|nr:cytochrome c1 [Pelagibacteraceae bacterium]
MLKKIFFILFTLFFFIPNSFSKEDVKLKKQNWSFQGIFGRFDNSTLQRGLQVYQEVCSACHGVKRLRFRELTNLGFTKEQIVNYAKTFEILDGPNELGEMFIRPGEPTDTFVSPYKNKEEAIAINGAYPPDLSLLTKAMKNGPDYIYSLLVGYEDPPNDFELPDGLYYNPYHDGSVIAIPQPLYDEAIEYIDGTNASIHQLSYDIVNFLSWAAEPELQKRKALGLKVLIFLIVLTALLYVTMKEIWSRIEK